jgi:(p)ppGpp synthase/HD superfamily hydrolase
MHYFAQTNIQLFNQLDRSGYSSADLSCIYKTYNLSMQLFTGAFRPSGKTFIAHLVGTASILAFLHAPIKVVATGLIHAAYEAGDFGDGRKGISPYRRQQLKLVLGHEIEEYVAQYFAFKWHEETILSTCDRFESLNIAEREILLIRLANELEEYLDLGLLYCGVLKQEQYSNRARNLILEMAEKLAGTDFSNKLKQAFQEAELAQIPIEFQNQTNRNYSCVIVPKSYKKRLFVVLCYFLSKTQHYLSKISNYLLSNQSSRKSTNSSNLQVKS